jgi:DNA modification methylase
LAYELLMAEERASAVFTDPPYSVKIDGNVCGSGAVKHREFAMASGEMRREEFARFLGEPFDLARAHASPGAIIYACTDWRHMAEMLAAGHAAKFELLNLCVWVKTKRATISNPAVPLVDSCLRRQDLWRAAHSGRAPKGHIGRVERRPPARRTRSKLAPIV